MTARTVRQAVAPSAVPTPPDSLRLSQATRDQLATLRRRTGVRHMNALCRWALCRSLAEPSAPPLPTGDAVVEIAWKVFAGAGGDVWWALLLMRCEAEGIRPSADQAAGLLRAHVARGVSYLVGDPEVKDTTSLVRLALEA